MPDAADRLEQTLSRQIIATDVLAMNLIKFGLLKHESSLVMRRTNIELR